MKSLKKLIKDHPGFMEFVFFIMRFFLNILIKIVPPRQKTMFFVSMGGRNFDDSPKAIYDEILHDEFFKDWELIWAFIQPERFEIPRGTVIPFGGMKYWKTLIKSYVWVGNGGLDSGLELSSKDRIIVNTWHGGVLKKSSGEENTNGVLKHYRKTQPLDRTTIRCVQNDFSINVFSRLFHADEKCFLKCGLPRDDILLEYTEDDKTRIKEQLHLPRDKKIVLYMPTYREYNTNEDHDIIIDLPLTLEKWEKELSDQCVLLLRAHYAVTSALHINSSDFVKDVSNYQPLSELYYIADYLITDYSSCFYDYAILGKPFYCYAYDREEYEQKRGLYIPLEEVMPCGIYETEDELIKKIKTADYQTEREKVEQFKKIWIPYYGNASKAIIKEITNRIKMQ